MIINNAGSYIIYKTLSHIIRGAASASEQYLNFKIYSFTQSIYLFMMINVTIFLHLKFIRIKKEIAGEGEKKEKLSIEKKIWKVTRLILSAWVLTGVAVCLTVFELYTDYSICSLNSNFKHKMAIIEPYVTDREFKNLKSQWALMRTGADYKQINDKIEELAIKQNIALPKLKSNMVGMDGFIRKTTKLKPVTSEIPVKKF